MRQNNVVDINRGTTLPPLAGDGNPPHDGGMESRIVRLEAIIPTLATKADMADLRTDMHKGQGEVKGWFIATAILVLVGMFTIANIMISNVRDLADRPTAAAIQPAPIVIQVPQPAQAPNP